MVYNPIKNEIILFGGMKNNLNQEASYLQDSWVFNCSDYIWREIETTNQPGRRISHDMIYDPENHQIVLFGGGNHQTSFNDTWLFNLTSYTWTEIAPAIAPSPRYDPRMFYDSMNNEIVLYGGYLENGYSNNTWCFFPSNNSWRELKQIEAPSARYGHRMVYSTTKEKGFLFAGHANGNQDRVTNDMWQYNSNSRNWMEIILPAPPSERYWHEMVYDETNGEIIIFGGRASGSSFLCRDDTWIFDENTEEWRQVIGEGPTARMLSSMVYNSNEKKLILFGGNRDPNTQIFDDLWEFNIETNTWKKIMTSLPTSTTTPGTTTTTEESTPQIHIVGILLTLLSLIMVKKRKKAK
ncbi:MAG: kelch repeat-containing protein [Candidatus Hodarchaeota archaeon]